MSIPGLDHCDCTQFSITLQNKVFWAGGRTEIDNVMVKPNICFLPTKEKVSA